MEQRTISRMTNEPIRLSALGRDVKVGDLYNYHKNLILKNNTVDLLNENIGSVSAIKNRSFYFKPDDKLKRHILGISSHFNHSINNGTVKGTSLWFNDYLQNNSTKEDDKNVAKIDFFLRLKRCTKRINETHFSDSKMYEYQLFSGGRATHLVEEVVYGAEFICSMRRDFDQSETQENAEKSLRIAAKAYIDEAINPNSISLKKQPVELTHVNCSYFCSLTFKDEVKGVKTQCASIQQFCEWLRENVSFDKDIAGVKWQAVEIVLRYIPDQIGAQVWLQMKNDFNLEKELIRAQFIYIQKESSEISKLPLIDSVSPFEKMMFQFLTLLSKLENYLDQWDKIDFSSMPAVSSMPVPETILSEMEEMPDLFYDMTEWLFKRRIDIENMCTLLKDIQPRIFDLSEIKALEPIANEEFAQVFLLQMDYVEDPLLKRIQKFTGTQDPSFKLPVFPLLAVGEHRFSQIEDSLKSFVSKSFSDSNTRYLIGLVSSSYLAKNGEVQKIYYQSENINQRENQPYLSNSSVSTLCIEKPLDSSQPNHKPKNIAEDIQKYGSTDRHQLTDEEQCSSTTEDGSQTELMEKNKIQTDAQNPSVPPSSISNTKDAEKGPNDGSQLLTTEILAKNPTKQSDQMESFKDNSNRLFSSDNQNNTATMTNNKPEEKRQRQSKTNLKSVADRIGNSRFRKLDGKLDSNMPSKTQTKSMQTNRSIVNSRPQNENLTVVQGQVPMAIDSNTLDQRTKPKTKPNEQSEQKKKKMAKVFTQKDYAELKKDGRPMAHGSIPCSPQSDYLQTNVDEDVKITGPIETTTKEQYAAVNSGDTKDVKKVPNNGSQIKTEYFEQKLTEQPTDQVGSLKEHFKIQNNAAIMQDCNLAENLQRHSKETSETVTDGIRSYQKCKFEVRLNSNMPSKTETVSLQTNPSTASSSSRQVKNSDVVQGPRMVIDFNTVDQGSKPIEQSVPEKKKIAEIFTQEEFAKLIKDGQPMVYQLNTEEKPVGENLRYFDIKGQTEASSSLENTQNLKVIILMGATGSGKSTLINGMINYILGVQWKDPFRFKCVREDSSVVRNEAHSQTDSVTAYTLHHREGMTIPYSITLIDTPGYGDTRGIERDKKITGCIHRFLTQQEIQIDQIHAICFVATSGDSRLTPTQRYVLDSVLSIFGEDVKENIRLLVTFADNAIPPVVEACRAAHFPMTSPSGGVMFNKFNSSVLYASNEKKEDSRIKIKEIMWNMGQRNYKSFFTMLESMNGRDLKSTRKVIRNRQLLEQPLQDIEVKLEVCFDTIENLEKRYLQQKNSDIEWNTYQDPKFELVLIEKIKVESLLEQVGKSERVLDSVALLRSHSLSPVDYLSLIRSRVNEEQRPGYEIRLQTLNELQNWFNENHPPNGPYCQDTHGSPRSTNKRSDPEKKTNSLTSSNDVRNRDTNLIRKSSDGETNTKKSQSTGFKKYSNANYEDRIHCENPTGGAEGHDYSTPFNKNFPMHLISAESEDPEKHYACSTRNSGGLSTGNKQTYLEMSDDQNLSELENPFNSETSSERSNEQKKLNLPGKFVNAAKHFFGIY